MTTNLLGSTQFPVSRMGLGCWQLGADWGEVSETRAHDILRAAVDSGITFFDTADVYGDGRSERLLGAFFGPDRAGITIATKYGRAGGIYPDGYSRAGMRAAVAASRERLGGAPLDLLQLHCVPTEVLRAGDVFEWLRELKTAGSIRHFGASVETMEEGLWCMEQEGLATLQIIFNIFRQKPLEQLLRTARARNVGIIVRLPLASGLLTGKFTSATTFPANDHRNYNRDGAVFNVGETFAGLPFERGVTLAEALKTDYLPDGMTLVQLALRWLLDQPAVSSVIAGASRPEQVRANAAVAELPPLSAELHERLASFYREKVHAAIRGPY